MHMTITSHQPIGIVTPYFRGLAPHGDHGEDDPEAEDDDAEEAYATHMEVDQEDQSHSDEEDDDSYE
jgi:hypothetical protein